MRVGGRKSSQERDSRLSHSDDQEDADSSSGLGETLTGMQRCAVPGKGENRRFDDVSK